MGISVPTTPGDGGAANVLQVARATATTDQALSGTPTIDGVALSATNRVLLTGQSSGAENGLWVAAAGAWARPSDYAAGATIQPNVVVPVAEGTANGDTRWQITDDGAVVVDTDPTTWGKTNLGLTEVADDASPELGGNLDCDAKEVTDASKLSVGIATAARAVEVLDDTDPQLRLTHTDATHYVDLQATSGGHAVIKTSPAVGYGFLRSSGTQSYMCVQNTTSGFADSLDGVYMGITGDDAYIWNNSGGASKLMIGTAGSTGITLDASNNATFVANLIADGNVTLGDASGDTHTVNGTMTVPDGLTYKPSTVVHAAASEAGPATVATSGTTYLITDKSGFLTLPEAVDANRGTQYVVANGTGVDSDTGSGMVRRTGSTDSFYTGSTTSTSVEIGKYAAKTFIVIGDDKWLVVG